MPRNFVLDQFIEGKDDILTRENIEINLTTVAVLQEDFYFVYNLSTCEVGKESGKSRSTGLKKKRPLQQHNLVCDQCSYQTSYNDNLKRHVQAKHQEYQYQCQECEYKSGTQGTMKLHVEAKHQGISFVCHQCNVDTKHLGGVI